MSNVRIIEEDDERFIQAVGTEVERMRIRFADDVQRTYNEAQDLLLSKHKDYGSKNIALSPGGPLNGLRVRMHDKLARLNNLMDTGQAAHHESLRDTLVDLANYALIGVLVLDERWPDA